MKSMGLMQDPTQQAMGLVQLMNTSQAPEIQQQQFGREMGFKELMGQQENDYRNRSLEQTGKQQEWQRRSGDRELGMRGQALELDRKKIGQDQGQFDEAMKLKRFSEFMGMLGLLTRGAMEPIPPGYAPQLNAGAVGQFGDQFIPGFSNFFGASPAAGGTGWEGMKGKNPEISDAALLNAMKQFGLKQ